jgi:hypothetical protein
MKSNGSTGESLVGLGVLVCFLMKIHQDTRKSDRSRCFSVYHGRLNISFFLSTGQGKIQRSLLNEKRLYNDARRCKDAFGGGRVDIESQKETQYYPATRKN